MFRTIDYGTNRKFEPIPIVEKKTKHKKYNDWDVIIGKSILNINEKNQGGNSILKLMKDMNK